VRICSTARSTTSAPSPHSTCYHFDIKRNQPERAAVFLRLPVPQAERLDEASQRLGTPKSRLVADLVASHLDADKPEPAIGALKGAPVGRAFFAAAEQPEVLTLEQLAELLSLDVEATLALAEAGELPGRKLGEEWRFSRSRILDWLSGD
jgi:excisionase family DNA binding protein